MGHRLRVRLTEGSGLTARQVATQPSRAGHVVEVLAFDPLCLSRFTRHVHRVHRVPVLSGAIPTPGSTPPSPCTAAPAATSCSPRSIEVPAVRKHLNTLGTRLGWHGALSADAILTADGPVYIDVNPRLVEPGNAWEAGVDLVGTLLDIARGTAPTVQPSGRPDIATHQLLIAVLAAAELRGRRGVLGEIAAAWRHADGYTDSTEELTPVRGDWRSAIPLATASAAVLARPSAWRWFASSAVANYGLTSAGWSAILDHRL